MQLSKQIPVPRLGGLLPVTGARVRLRVIGQGHRGALLALLRARPGHLLWMLLQDFFSQQEKRIVLLRQVLQ